MVCLTSNLSSCVERSPQIRDRLDRTLESGIIVHYHPPRSFRILVIIFLTTGHFGVAMVPLPYTDLDHLPFKSAQANGW